MTISSLKGFMVIIMCIYIRTRRTWVHLTDIPAERERGWEKLCSSEVRAWRFAVSRICQFVLDKHLGGSSLSLPNTRDSWHGWNLQVWWFLALGLFRLPFWTDAARLPTRKRRNSRKEEKKSLWHVQGEMKVETQLYPSYPASFPPTLTYTRAVVY